MPSLRVQPIEILSFPIPRPLEAPFAAKGDPLPRVPGEVLFEHLLRLEHGDEVERTWRSGGANKKLEPVAATLTDLPQITSRV
jgi:hypothetical protein